MILLKDINYSKAILTKNTLHFLCFLMWNIFFVSLFFWLYLIQEFKQASVEL